jgi:hypothetical protein
VSAVPLPPAEKIEAKSNQQTAKVEVLSPTVGASYLSLAPGGPNENERFVLVEGSRGTSKTRSLLTILLARALNAPRSRWALARSTKTLLADTVLRTLEEQVFPAFNMKVPGGALSRQHRAEYILPNGAAFVPLSLDEQHRTQSAEYAGIYVAEVTEIPTENTVLSLAGALRQVVTRLDGKPHVHQLIADCNPASPSHWANQAAQPIDDELRRATTRDQWMKLLRFNYHTRPRKGQWKRIVTRVQDNPGYWDLEGWKYWDIGEAYHQTLAYLRGPLRRRWLDGEWTAAEGAVFEADFDARQHVIHDFDVPSDWPWWVFCDPGYDHPCAIPWFTMSPNGTVYVADLRYTGGAWISQHAAWIVERLQGRNVRGWFLDPRHGFSKTAQSPLTISEQFGSCGLKRFAPWPRKSGAQVEAHVNVVRQWLGEGKLKFFTSCTEAIAEMEAWKYKRNSNGERLTGDDQYEDKDNHFIDCLLGFAAIKPRFDGGIGSVVSPDLPKPRVGGVFSRRNIIAEVLGT